jgi:hypothetical protein
MKSILTLLFVAVLCASHAFAADPITLTLASFNDTKGNPPPPGWVEEEGGIIHRKEKSGDLISKDEFSSFTIEWDWKIAEGGNSGLKYWVNQFPKGGWLGIEYQMIDDERHPDAKKGDNHCTASLYDLKKPDSDKHVNPAGEWNSSKVIVKDGVIQHYINGKLVAEEDTKTPDWEECVARSKFKNVKGFAPGKGHFLLQDHGAEVWFKNIKVTPL